MSDVYIYRRVAGRKTEEYLAMLDVVQAEVDDTADQIVHRADDLLKDHRQDKVAHIEFAKGDIDAYAVLVDSNITNSETAKSNTALSIEFGRAGFIDPTTGEEWGEMEGLFILTNAANSVGASLPTHGGSKSRRVPLAKPRRGRGGKFRRR